MAFSLTEGTDAYLGRQWRLGGCLVVETRPGLTALTNKATGLVNRWICALDVAGERGIECEGIRDVPRGPGILLVRGMVARYLALETVRDLAER